jgi:A/G-specific adenine glycosylase
VRRADPPRGDEGGADRGWWTGLWQFPGGEVRTDETAAAAATRLAREMLGLEVRPRAMAGVVRHGVTRWKITLEAWHCEIEDAEAALPPRPDDPTALRVRETVASYDIRSADGLECCWFPIEETARLALPAPQRRLIEQIRHQAGSGALRAEQQPLLEV